MTGKEEENVTEDAKNDVVEDDDVDGKNTTDDIKETAKEEKQDETIVSHKNVELAEEANAKAEGLKERLRLLRVKYEKSDGVDEEWRKWLSNECHESVSITFESTMILAVVKANRKSFKKLYERCRNWACNSLGDTHCY